MSLQTPSYPTDCPQVVVVDFFDSFTYNLVGYLRLSTPNVAVLTATQATPEAVAALHPDGILLSPGPGHPAHYPLANRLLDAYCGVVPLLGVCMGMQLLAAHFGAQVSHAKRQMHGKVSAVRHDGLGVFRGMPNPFTAMRYHSLAVQPPTLPPFFCISAQTDDGEVMGIRHSSVSLEGVQFHPESILTQCGKLLVQNWVDSLARQPVSQ